MSAEDDEMIGRISRAIINSFQDEDLDNYIGSDAMSCLDRVKLDGVFDIKAAARAAILVMCK